MAQAARRTRTNKGRSTPPRSGAGGDGAQNGNANNGASPVVDRYDEAAELAVVASVVGWDAPRAIEVTSSLEVEDLGGRDGREVFAAARAIAARGDKPNQLLISAELERTGLALSEPGFLFDLLDAQMPSSSLPPLVARIAEKAALRRAGALVAELHFAVQEGRLGDIGGLVEKVGSTVGFGIDAGTWGLVDLAGVMDGLEAEQPTLLTRDDGVKLLYPGRVHAFNAESESGKSWAALLACKQEMDLGGHVLYVDFEDSAAGVVGRLVAMGAEPHEILERFHYLRPDDPITDSAKAAVLAMTRSFSPSLCVLDGVTEAMALSGWSIKENDDIALFFAALARPIARLGTTVILIDHVVKDRDTRGKDAIGGQHKRAGIDGASYMFDVVKPFGRGMSGLSRVTVAKDRHGAIREAARSGTTIGELHVIGLAGGGVSVGIRAPMSADSDGGQRPTIYMERVSRAIEDANTAGQKPSVRQVQTLVHGNKPFIVEALKLLIAERHVTITNGPRNAIAHVMAKPYRQVDDPLSPEFQGPPSGPFDPHHDEEF